MTYRPWYKPCRKHTLTARQEQVMDLICRGKSDSDIAAILNVSRDTARNHVRDIRRKLCAENRTLAVAKYLAPERFK